MAHQLSNCKSPDEKLRHFRTLVDRLPQIVWIARPDGYVEYHNQKWFELTGRSPEEVDGDTLWNATIHPDDWSRAMAKWADALEKGHDYEIEYRLWCAQSQRYRWFLSRMIPYRNQAGVIERWYGTATAICRRIEAEEDLRHAKEAAEAANQTKNEFVANIVHEIRNPLSAILGYADLMKKHPPTAESAGEWLSALERNAQLLFEIVDDLRDLSKIEAGEVQVEWSTVDLPQLVDEVVAFVEEKFGKEAPLTEVNFAADAATLVRTDETKLRQILLNLVNNAVKFTPAEGRVTLEIDAPRTDGATELVVSIKDSGIGIAPEKQQAVFKPFHQGSHEIKNRYGGTGLGLALSRTLSQALGGDLELKESVPGRGSHFQVHMPVYRSDAWGAHYPCVSRGKQAAGGEAAQEQPLRGLHVLVVEDSPDLQLLTGTLLEEAGAGVDYASNGSEGVHKALENSPDLVLMDIQLPEMDGYEATRSLRDQGYRRPVVAVTARALKEEESKSRACGCDGYLTKPVSPKDLIQAVKRLASAHPSS